MKIDDKFFLKTKSNFKKFDYKLNPYYYIYMWVLWVYVDRV